MLFGVLEDADDDGHSHFSYRHPLAPDGVTSKTVFPDSLTVISIEFYLGSQTRLILAVILTEGIWKNCFRRHAIWSQRDVDMKNDYAHPVPNSFRFVRFLGERPHNGSHAVTTIRKKTESQQFTSSDLNDASRLIAFEDLRGLTPSFVKSIETLPLSQRMNLSKAIVVREERERKEKNCPCKALSDNDSSDPSAHHPRCK
ncbi:hypothetical protein PRIPAC_84156 [Pristionchus pacificus]|uniref:Uncharacterized protein n=1 Tax=Pristionchus pacificus TaxID=54126 RepID=A0A2A6BUH5_PRIPA|nr:hypothetical protein PRIPAC_84156 [Pristionchus pacificus]|eukprot:PDM69411.1 hypothetical protein PRIPAC_44507 [Pristionchus pacificus]